MQSDTPNPCAPPPLTNAKFAGYTARLAQKAAAWSADTTMSFVVDQPDEAIRREMAMRFLSEIRQLLDHIEKQVQP